MYCRRSDTKKDRSICTVGYCDSLLGSHTTATPWHMYRRSFRLYLLFSWLFCAVYFMKLYALVNFIEQIFREWYVRIDINWGAVRRFRWRVHVQSGICCLRNWKPWWNETKCTRNICCFFPCIYKKPSTNVFTLKRELTQPKKRNKEEWEEITQKYSIEFAVLPHFNRFCTQPKRKQKWWNISS